MRVLIAGCGYVGLELGRQLAAAGADVVGVRRSPDALPLLAAAGIRAHLADLAEPDSLRGAPGPWDQVVFCAAPGGGGEEAYRRTYLAGARSLLLQLEAADRAPGAFAFTSSTSVYPQTDGSMVTEDADADPATPTARVLRDAENLLLEAAHRGFPARILRVAGIYGPRRTRIESFLAGCTGPGPDGTRWMNFIHRDDVVSAIMAVLEGGRNGRIYNAADDTPAQASDFYGWLGRHCGTPAPPADAPSRGTRRSRAETSKRVSSARLRQELGWKPAYASFREGYLEMLRRGES